MNHKKIRGLISLSLINVSLFLFSGIPSFAETADKFLRLSHDNLIIGKHKKALKYINQAIELEPNGVHLYGT